MIYQILHALFGWHYVKWQLYPRIEPHTWAVSRVRESPAGKYVGDWTGIVKTGILPGGETESGGRYIPLTWVEEKKRQRVA